MIKFRVYDKHRGRYWTTEEAADYVINGNGEHFVCIGRDDGRGNLSDDLMAVDPDRYIVEQFTGFCDKDGREVYEGDTFAYGFLPGRLFIKRVKTKIGYCLALWNEAFGCTMDIALVLEQESVTGTIHDAEASGEVSA